VVKRTLDRRFVGLVASAAGLALVLAVPCSPAAASTWTPRPAQYGEGVTRDVKITMRDGVQLAADVHYPTNPDGRPATGPFPVILSETPYGKELVGQEILDTFSGYEPYLVRRGYIDVIVDVRGSGGSQGIITLFGADEAADSKEVIEWASTLPNANGNVGMTGESYLAINQLFAAAAVGPDSPLKAIFPIDAANDPYKDLFMQGGLLNIESSAPLLGIYAAFPLINPVLEAAIDPPTIATYGPLIKQRLQALQTGFAVPTLASILTGGDRAHEDAYWRDPHRLPASALPAIVANGVPAYLVGGLYDVFQRGAPLNYAGLQNAWAGRPAHRPMLPDQPVTSRYQLLMKPHYHTNANVGEPDLNPIQLAWFDHWLKGEDTGIEQTTTPLHLVQPDGLRREARRFPLDQTSGHTMYLGAGGTLTAGKPASTGADQLAFTGVSLPCDRSTEQWGLGVLELALAQLPLGLGDPCADQDLVPASVGPGRLDYTSPPLTHDTVLAGPITASIFATANTTDTEWIAKLSDVGPDGRSVDLTQGELAGSHRALDEERTWRNRAGDPVLPHHPDTRASKAAVVPGALTRYDIEIRSTFATLEAGHRFRLTLMSSQSPHLIPVPTDIGNFVGGRYEVQRSPAAPSSLQLPLADPSSFPDDQAVPPGPTDPSSPPTPEPAAPSSPPPPAPPVHAPPCAAPHASVDRRTLRVRRTRLTIGGHTRVPCTTRAVKRVQLALARRSGARCRWLKPSGRFTRPTSCRRPVLRAVTGAKRWRFSLRHTPLTQGTYVVFVQATDRAGRRAHQPTRPSLTFRVRR